MNVNEGKLAVREVVLNEELISELIELSGDWEHEDSCYGYRKNAAEDIVGNRVFLAVDGHGTAGYLFGHKEVAKSDTSICQKDEEYFEIEELYVKPSLRGRGIGKLLFQYVEEQLKDEVDLIMLSTATKNYRAILHFYIDELDMNFWSARLFKRI